MGVTKDLPLGLYPVEDYILIKQQSLVPEKTKSGLMLQTVAEDADSLIWAEIISVGPKVRAQELAYNSSRILINPYSAQNIAGKYYFCKEKDILAVTETNFNQNYFNILKDIA